MASLVAFRCCL